MKKVLKKIFTTILFLGGVFFLIIVLITIDGIVRMEPERTEHTAEDLRFIPRLLELGVDFNIKEVVHGYTSRKGIMTDPSDAYCVRLDRGIEPESLIQSGWYSLPVEDPILNSAFQTAMAAGGHPWFPKEFDSGRFYIRYITIDFNLGVVGESSVLIWDTKEELLYYARWGIESTGRIELNKLEKRTPIVAA